jgi:predicted glycoside hydrolase/deacetylase ChbG (UPF0249 family)
VSADDLGLTAGVDRGILRAVAAGSVTSVSVLPNLVAPATVTALAAAAPAVSIGAHLNLTTGCPVLPPGAIASLVDGAGAFLPLQTLARRAVAGRLAPVEIQAELDAQLARLRATGAAVDHLDSHEHAHLLPGVAAAVVHVAQRAHIPWLRCHRPRLLGPGSVVRYYRRRPRRLVAHAAKRLLAARFRAAGLAGPDGMVAPSMLLAPVGGGPLREWAAIAAALPPGLWELVVHPADLGVADDVSSSARLGDLVARRGAELAALTDPRFPALLAERGVTLASFRGEPHVPPTKEAHARRRA